MHFQDQCGLARDRASEITEGSLVGCSNFTQPRATRFEDFRNPEPAADLNQFAARNHDLIFAQRISVMSVFARARSYRSIIFTKMSKNQNKRTRVVIHYCRSFRAAKERKILFEVRSATAATALGDSILE